MFSGKFKKSLFDTDNTAQQLEGCAEYLVKLYNEHEPAYYPLPDTGILSSETLKLARSEVISKIKSGDTGFCTMRAQCLKLLTRLNKRAIALGLPDQGNNLQIYRDRFNYPDTLGDNAAYHLSSTKRVLEHVCYLLDSDKIPAQRQEKVMLELCTRLAACASGAQTEITYALRMLKGHIGITASFQALMETAFKVRYIPSHPKWISELNTHTGNEIHIVNAYVFKCCGPEFLPYITTLDPDAIYYAKRITNERVESVRKGFWEYMTPEKVINDLVENVFQQLTLTFQELSQLPDFQDENLSQWLASFLGISADLVPEFTYTVASIKPNRIDPSIRDWLKLHIKNIILEASDAPQVITESQFFSVEKACQLAEAAKEITPVAYQTDAPLTEEPLLPINEYLAWAKKIAPHFDMYTDQLVDIYLRAYTYYDDNYAPWIDIDKIAAQFRDMLHHNPGEKQLLIRLSQIHSLIQHDPKPLRQCWTQTPAASDDYIDYFSWVQALDKVCDTPTWKTLTSAFSSVSSEPGFDHSFLLSTTLFKNNEDPVENLSDLGKLYAQNPDQFITKALVLHHYHKQIDAIEEVLKLMSNCFHADPHYYERNKSFVWSVFMLGFQLMDTRTLDVLYQHQQETEVRTPLLESAVFFAAENKEYTSQVLLKFCQEKYPIEIEEIVLHGNEAFTSLALESLTSKIFETSLKNYLWSRKTLSQDCFWLYTCASDDFKQKVESAHYTLCQESMAQENPDADVVADILKDLEWVLGLFSSNRPGQDEKKALFELYADIPGMRERRAFWQFAMTIPGLLLEQYGNKPFIHFMPNEMHATMLLDPKCQEWIVSEWEKNSNEQLEVVMQAWEGSDWRHRWQEWCSTPLGFKAFTQYLSSYLSSTSLASLEEYNTDRASLPDDFASSLTDIIYEHLRLPSNFLCKALRQACDNKLPTSLAHKHQTMAISFKRLPQSPDESGQAYQIQMCIDVLAPLIYGDQPLWEALSVSTWLEHDTQISFASFSIEKRHAWLALTHLLSFATASWSLKHLKPTDTPSWLFVKTALNLVPELRLLNRFNLQLDMKSRQELFNSGEVPASLILGLILAILSIDEYKQHPSNSDLIDKLLSFPTYCQYDYLMSVFEAHPTMKYDIRAKRFEKINLAALTRDDISWIETSLDDGNECKILLEATKSTQPVFCYVKSIYHEPLAAYFLKSLADLAKQALELESDHAVRDSVDCLSMLQNLETVSSMMADLSVWLAKKSNGPFSKNYVYEFAKCLKSAYSPDEIRRYQLWRLPPATPSRLEQYGDKPFTDFTPSENHAFIFMDKSCDNWIADQFSSLSREKRLALLAKWEDSDWKDTIFQWYQTDIGFKAFSTWLEDCFPYKTAINVPDEDRDFAASLADVIFTYHGRIQKDLLQRALQKIADARMPSELDDIDQIFEKTLKRSTQKINGTDATISCCMLVSALIYHEENWIEDFWRKRLYDGQMPPGAVVELIKHIEKCESKTDIADRILSIPAYCTFDYLTSLFAKHITMDKAITEKRLQMIDPERITNDDLWWIKSSYDGKKTIYIKFSVRHRILKFVLDLKAPTLARSFYTHFIKLAESLLSDKKLTAPFSLPALLDNLEYSASNLLKFLCSVSASSEHSHKVHYFNVALQERYKLNSHDPLDFLIEFPVHIENVLDIVTYYLPLFPNEKKRHRVLTHWRNNGLIPDTKKLCKELKENAEDEEKLRAERLLLADQIALWLSTEPVEALLIEESISDLAIHIDIMEKPQAYVNWLSHEAAIIGDAQKRCIKIVSGKISFAREMYVKLMQGSSNSHRLAYHTPSALQLLSLNALPSNELSYLIFSRIANTWWNGFSSYYPYFFTEKDEHEIFRKIFDTLSLNNPQKMVKKWREEVNKTSGTDLSVLYFETLNTSITNNIKFDGIENGAPQSNFRNLQNPAYRPKWAAQPVLRDALLGKLLTPHTKRIGQVRHNWFGRSKTRAFLKMTNMILSVKGDDVLYAALKAAFARFLWLGGKKDFGRLDGKHRRAIIAAFGLDETYAKEARMDYLREKIDALKHNGRLFSALYGAFKCAFHYERQYNRLKNSGIVEHANPQDNTMPFKDYDHWKNVNAAREDACLRPPP